MSGTPVFITDSVLREIDVHIGSHDPERGGALLGPKGVNAVTMFIADTAAEVTSASYRSSTDLANEVQEAEKNNSLLEFKGIIHSHPGCFDRPSGQDEIAFADTLKLNPWMPTFLGPILVRHRPWRPHGSNRITLGVDRWLSMWEASITPSIQTTPVPIAILPIDADLDEVGRKGVGQLIAGPELIEGASGPELAAQIETSSGIVTLVFPWSYPEQPPLAIVEAGDFVDDHKRFGGDQPNPADDEVEVEVENVQSDYEFLDLTWDSDNDRATLALALAAELTPPEQETTVQAGPEPIGEDLSPTTDACEDGPLDRLVGIVPPLAHYKVAVFGVGSVGSHAAELLCRSGVGTFLLVDPEDVEEPNLSRCVFTTSDLGTAKVDALAARLLDICPTTTVETRRGSVSEFTAVELSDLMAEVDLVIAATDDPDAQLRINHHAYASEVISVFPGVYARGQGGEVITTIPGATPCFRCATVGRSNRSRRPASDYGTGRLLAEPALGADILHITTAATKLALSALSAGSSDHELGKFLADALAIGNYLVLSTVPELDFLATVFERTAGQFAYQAVWLETTRAEDCPVCGDEVNRVDPRSVERIIPRLDQLQHLRRPLNHQGDLSA